MEENAISGDDNTHWFHSNGIITSIDNSQKKICVDISQKNNFFDGTNITLNCNKSSLDITYLEAGQEITFYFFENNVEIDFYIPLDNLIVFFIFSTYKWCFFVPVIHSITDNWF